MNYIISLLDWLEPYGVYSYAFMFGFLIACGFGFPMPEDVVLITGGILAARHIVSLPGTFLVTMAGVMIGDGIIFFIGRRMGPRLRQTPFFQKMVPEAREKKIMALFKKYGDKVIFFARFAPGLRMPIFMTSGIYQVPAWKFLLLDGFAALISVPVWIWVGHAFGSNFEVLQQKIEKMQMSLYSLLGILLVVLIAVYLVKKKLKAVSE